MFPRTSGRKSQSRNLCLKDWQHEDVSQTAPSAEKEIRSKLSPTAVPFVPTDWKADSFDTVVSTETMDFPVPAASPADVVTSLSVNQALAVPTATSPETDKVSTIGCTTSAIDTPRCPQNSGRTSSMASVDDLTTCQAGEHTVTAYPVDTATSATDHNASDPDFEEDAPASQVDGNAIAASHAANISVYETDQKSSPAQVEENAIAAFHPVDIASLEIDCAWWLQSYLQTVPPITPQEPFDWDQTVAIYEEEDWEPWIDNSDLGDEEDFANLQAAVEELEHHYATHTDPRATMLHRPKRLLAWILIVLWLVACAIALRWLKL